MKVVRIILYICGGLFLALIGLFVYFIIFVEPYMEDPGFAQTMTVGGKKVHLVMDGPGSYKAEASGNDIVVNGKTHNLSGADEFTVVIKGDGSTAIRPGKP